MSGNTFVNTHDRLSRIQVAYQDDQQIGQLDLSNFIDQLHQEPEDHLPQDKLIVNLDNSEISFSLLVQDIVGEKIDDQYDISHLSTIILFTPK